MQLREQMVSEIERVFKTQFTDAQISAALSRLAKRYLDTCADDDDEAIEHMHDTWHLALEEATYSFTIH